MAIIDEFVGLIGWKVDDEELKDNEETVNDTEKSYKKLNTALNIVAATFSTVLFTSVNRSTAEMDSLSKSVGMNTETMLALSEVVAVAGFTFENVIDLAEELNNKLGESKGVEEMTAVKEATDILGLSFEELNKQSPEDQFIAVLQAAKDLEDQQKAVAAADILLGAEANRIVGVLREEEGTLEQVIARFKELNFLTEEGIEGATDYTKELGRLSNSLGSLGRQISGLLGAALVPLLESINDLIAANAEVISNALLWFFENLEHVVTVLGGAFGFLIALKIPAILGAITTGVVALLGAIFSLPALIAAVAIGFGLLFDDIVTFFNGGDSLVGRFIDSLKGMAADVSAVFDELWDSLPDWVKDIFSDSGPQLNAQTLAAETSGQVLTPEGNLTNATSNTSNTVQQNNDVTIQITQQPGESGAELANRVNASLGREVANATRQLNNGIER